ncbi:hypothetical protein TIFTF001_012142 [Ficus carica]|uniref:Uncharacterized protein n=1 Tax=Ficus carica TaxID=3494 RepID=A0AA88A1U7_FICCA|nr:hypothetical protein TIFTF001_012142 [Ficus carica]
MYILDHLVLVPLRPITLQVWIGWAFGLAQQMLNDAQQLLFVLDDRGGWVGNGGCLCWLLPFIHPDLISICHPLGLALVSAGEAWFDDGMVELGCPIKKN